PNGHMVACTGSILAALGHILSPNGDIVASTGSILATLGHILSPNRHMVASTGSSPAPLRPISPLIQCLIIQFRPLAFKVSKWIIVISRNYGFTLFLFPVFHYPEQCKCSCDS